MTMFYSKSTGGFYDSIINKYIPDDAVEITDLQHKTLLSSQANGQIITSDQAGNPIAVDAPPLTNDELITQYNFFAQNHLDSVAKSWGYDSLMSAASYANSTNPQFKAEAEALISWRDAYWAEAYTIEAGTLPVNAASFIAALPAAPSKPTL